MLGSRIDLVETLGVIAERKEADFQPERRDAHVQSAASDAAADLVVECVELEREIAKVAVTVHSRNNRVHFKCPVCDERMSLRDEETISEFGSLDIKLHKLECTCCGMSTGRVFHPALGYRELHR